MLNIVIKHILTKIFFTLLHFYQLNKTISRCLNLCKDYPKVTSKIIITTNPIAKPIVAILL